MPSMAMQVEAQQAHFVSAIEFCLRSRRFCEWRLSYQWFSYKIDWDAHASKTRAHVFNRAQASLCTYTQMRAELATNTHSGRAWGCFSTRLCFAFI